MIGDQDFCTSNEPCEVNEGDCDSNDECKSHLFCGSNNCPASLLPEIQDPDECTGSCYESEWKGDNYCDDENNNCGCGWDGGDCCGSNVNTELCSVCECLDSCFGTCGFPDMKGDNFCDDENNNCGCGWDGGDCCGSNVDTYYCTACECLEPISVDCCEPKGTIQYIFWYVLAIIYIL